MQPKRRTRLSSRPRFSVAASAAEPCSSGWLAVRRRPTKRPRRLVDSDGTPLMDEILVSIFAGLTEIADLVRVAATCRRWRRLVSSEAAFISRALGRQDRYLRCLAVGFFHQGAAVVAPRFGPMASAISVFGRRRAQTSLNKIVEDLDDENFDSCRVVTSRNGMLVVSTHRGKHDRAVRLYVCNPMTGETDILPPLTGKDGVSHYACALITADDYDHENSQPPQSPGVYRVFLVYSRRSFTASRCYSSEDGTWSPEAKVINTGLLGKIQMGLTHAAVVVRGGKEVYWIAKNMAFGLHIDTSEVKLLSLPWGFSPSCRYYTVADTLLGVSPDGMLCAVQIEELFLFATATQPRSIALRVYTRGHVDDDAPMPWITNWEKKELIRLEHFLSSDVTKVRLRWFCEKSGVILFTVDKPWKSEVYALSLETQKVEKVAIHDTTGAEPWGNFHGYEMDLTAYLATLGYGADEEE